MYITDSGHFTPITLSCSLLTPTDLSSFQLSPAIPNLSGHVDLGHYRIIKRKFIFVCVCVNVCVNVCMCMYMYVYMCVNVHVYLWVYVCDCVCVCVCM